MNVKISLWALTKTPETDRQTVTEVIDRHRQSQTVIDIHRQSQTVTDRQSLKESEMLNNNGLSEN